MTNTFYNKLKDFLKYMPQNEMRDDESANLALLLRFICITVVIYYADITICLSILGSFQSALPAIVGMCLLVILFAATYFKVHLNTFMTFLVLVPIITNTMLSSAFGGMTSFIILPILGITLVYSSIVFSLKQKVLFSVLITAYVLFMKLHFASGEAVGYPSYSNQMYTISAITIFCAALYISAVSTYFCMRFTQAEHQVYIYNRQLKRMASLDPLTGIMNRRGMNEIMTELMDDYAKGTKGLSIAIGDIDFFKKINDQYGHDAGDYILKSLSAMFSEYMEGKGEVCRWGGEEFLFAFTELSADDSFLQLSELRHIIKHTDFTFNNIVINITMTFGLDEFSNSAGIEKTIKNADEKLYQGKEAGRDRVVY